MWNSWSSNSAQIDFPVDADPGLLALAYDVSIDEEYNPAANEFQEKDKLVNHYNDCVTTRKRFLDKFNPIKRNFVYTKYKFDIISNQWIIFHLP